MSRRAGKLRRSGERPKASAGIARESGGDRAESRPIGRVGWKTTILLAALAVATIAVFFWQMLRDTSFLSAITGIETRRLRSSNIFAEFDAKFAAQSCANRHRVVKGLLGAVIDIDRGKLTAPSILQLARQVEANDAENAVSRLALAYIAEASIRDRSVSERFEAIRQVMEAQPPAASSRIYKRERMQTWLETLGAHIQRADVRANLTQEMDLDRDVHEHNAALPIICRRLAELCGSNSDLSQANRDKCRLWLLAALTELMDSEPDSGTRLLCAELVSRVLDSDTSAHNQTESLVSSFKTDACAARPELTDMMRAPTPCQRSYRRVVDSFAAGLSMGLAGIGSAICWLILGALGRMTGGGSFASNNVNGKPPSLLALAGLPTMIAATILLQLSRDGPFSESWILLAAIVSMLGGIFSPIVLSFTFGRVSALAWQRRYLFHFSVCLAVVAALAIAPSYPSWWAKRLGGTLNFGIVLAVIMTVLIAVSVMTAGVSMRRIASSAMRSWAVLMCLSVMILAVHQYWDGEYLSGITAARMDEVTARLGPDWKERYLTEAEKAVGMVSK